MNASLLEPLLQSPRLVEHVAELNRVVAAEHQSRLKFYAEMTEKGKWEFINGQVVLQSPAKNRHNAATLRLSQLLAAWVNVHQFGHVAVEKALCQFPRNDYEPDIVFFGLEKSHRLQPDTLLHPVPDFIVEVLSRGTETIDRGIKFEDYQAHGVGEYWIVDPEAETMEQFIAADNHYPKKVKRQKTGKVTSTVVTGFEIPIRAIFDDAANLAALRQLLA